MMFCDVFFYAADHLLLIYLNNPLNYGLILRHYRYIYNPISNTCGFDCFSEVLEHLIPFEVC